MLEHGFLNYETEVMRKEVGTMRVSSLGHVLSLDCALTD